MADLTAQRTLVKSPPELWSELSEVEGLAKHLGELGEIRITKVEPETTVAWEGEQISGTVELEQSGWGTRVTFRATVPEPDLPPEATWAPEPEAVTEPQAEPEAFTEPHPAPEATATLESESEQPDRKPERGNFITRWLFRERRSARTTATEAERVAKVTVATEPEPMDEPEPIEPPSAEVERVQQVLDGTLEALGQAHHRPFSRG